MRKNGLFEFNALRPERDCTNVDNAKQREYLSKLRVPRAIRVCADKGEA